MTGTVHIKDGSTSQLLSGKVTDNGTLVFDIDKSLTDKADTNGSGAVVKNGAGTVTLAGINRYKGGTSINNGTLVAGNYHALGNGLVSMADGSSLAFAWDGIALANDFALSGNATVLVAKGQTNTLDGLIVDGGTQGALTKTGDGTLVLTNSNTYSGGTNIQAGTLQLGDGVGNINFYADPGKVNISSGATLRIDVNLGSGGAFISSIDSVFSGSGNIVLAGPTKQIEVFTGTSKDFSGTTTVKSGLLFIGDVPLADSDAFLGGNVSVDSGAALGGYGTIGGNVTILDGGIVRFGRSYTNMGIPSGNLTVQGNFTAAQGSQINITLETVSRNAEESSGNTIHVGGNLNLDGVSLDIGWGGVGHSNVDPGVYNVFTYGGTLSETNGGITLTGNDTAVAVASLPAAKRIVLVSTPTSGSLEYWNANNKSTAAGRGGNGTWSAVAAAWNTSITGDTSNTAWTNDDFAVFDGTPGTVTVDNTKGVVTASGMQFAVDGYTLTGGPLNLSAPTGIRVGNGSFSSNNMKATINANLTGSGALLKLGPGTLFLSGTNTYSGGTRIIKGTLAISNAAALGSGDLTLGRSGILSFAVDGLTLTNPILLSSEGTVEVAAGQTAALAGTISNPYDSGEGSLEKIGDGTLVLTNTTAYAAEFDIHAGTLRSTSATLGKAYVDGTGMLDAVPGITGRLTNYAKVAVHGGDTTVGGNYLQDSSSTLAVSLGSKLAITGTATLHGGTLEITGVDQGYVADQHTDVLTAKGGVSGTFDQLVKDKGVVFTSSRIHYGTNEVWLDTTGLDVTTAAAGNGVVYTPASMGSAVRVQGAFDKLNQKMAQDSLEDVSGNFVKAAGEFQQAPTYQAAQVSLESLSGQLHAASAAMTLQTIDVTGQALSERLQKLAAHPQQSLKPRLWAHNLRLSGALARSGYDKVGYQLGGWLIGSDLPLGQHTVAGFALTQGNGIERLRQRFDTNNSRHTAVMAYVGYMHKRWFAHARVGLGHYYQNIHRMLLLGRIYHPVQTDYSGNYTVLAGQSGLHLRVGSINVSPFVGLEYDHLERGAFTEHGAGGFGLKASRQVVQRLQGGIGFKLGRQWTLSSQRSVGFSARIEHRQNLSSSGTAFAASFVGMTDWQPLEGVGLSRHSTLMSLDFTAKPSRRTHFKLGYEYLRGTRGHAGTLAARFGMAF